MIFHRIIVGVDGSPAGAEALRQARALKSPGGTLLALAVADTHLAGHAGLEAADWDQRLRAEAESAREAAERVLSGEEGTEARAVTGRPGDELLAIARQEGADLIAVGSHGGSRAAGIAFGSVATLVVHEATCSVLVAREGPASGPFPQSIVVGVDGSEQAAEAERVARALAAATDASLQLVTATGGKPLGEEIAADVTRDERAPVDALVDASRSSALVVLGSRGAHGIASLGSVAERVAHRAKCSVLVVRTAPGSAGAE